MIASYITYHGKTHAIYCITDENGNILGYLRSNIVEVPARGVFYPCTTTRIEWWSRTREGVYNQYKTRKEAVSAIS